MIRKSSIKSLILAATTLIALGAATMPGASAATNAHPYLSVASTGVDSGASPDATTGSGFTYQGRLTSSNNPANGQYDLRFTLFDSLTGGNQIGSQLTLTNQSVTNGLFTVSLDFGASSFMGDARYLQIEVRQTGGGSYTLLAPRQSLTPAPYALSLRPGALINGALGTSLLTVTNTGSQGTGLSGVADNGSAAKGVYGESTNGTGGSFSSTTGIGVSASGADGVSGTGTATDGNGVRGTANNGSNARGVTGISSAGSGVYGTSTTGYGGNFNATDGVGVIANGVAGVYATSNSSGGVAVTGMSSGSQTIGVWGESNAGTGVEGDSSTGYGVYGSSAGSDGVYGLSTANNGRGVYGVANTGSTAAGVYGTSTAGYGGDFASTSGTAVYATGGNGIYGVGTASNGVGVWGVANTGTSAKGVYGTSSTGTGVYGTSAASSGYGVRGLSGTGTYAAGVYGSSANGSFGVEGLSDTGSAIYGSSASNWAGFFSGNVHVSGSCCGAGEYYTSIDDPLDPQNKYLDQALVQSPDLLSLISGNATLDAQGQAVVTIPSWFEAANTDFRYTLTSIGAPGPNLYIAQKVTNSSFKIAGGAPLAEVSWQVLGTRSDPYALAHTIKPETDKPSDQQGKYLHPAEYGQPGTKAIEDMTGQSRP